MTPQSRSWDAPAVGRTLGLIVFVIVLVIGIGGTALVEGWFR